MDNSLILLVEDEAAIREMLQFSLGRAGFEMIMANEVNTAKKCMQQQIPDIILLDWMLPGISGIEFAKQLRKNEKTSQIPIIMITARTEEDDMVLALEAGADDYITKPFSTKELVARIKSVLRRSKPDSGGEIIKVENLVLDPVSQRVTIDNKSVNLGPLEYRLLHFFMTHTERVFSRSQLLDFIWGENVYIDERTVDVHIRRLRKVISVSACDRFVQTVRGSGYRFSTKEN
ncbi:Phosphate regulon transcriptional regulatory protein PhoB (SphR) [hydrothermal vent metagenome]|uniref:Phosphate regulon transcriptional regulatory protein PhoB n=1 Tax=hydrothermal vent metagenome TaxID=652676 RepID=A0A3B0ZUW8_9ZZZZ